MVKTPVFLSGKSFQVVFYGEYRVGKNARFVQVTVTVPLVAFPSSVTSAQVIHFPFFHCFSLSLFSELLNNCHGEGNAQEERT